MGYPKPKLAKEVQRVPPGRQHGKLENPLSNEGCFYGKMTYRMGPRSYKLVYKPS